MSNLSLKPVTGKNRRAAEELEVFPHQTKFIESVAECMKEADQLAEKGIRFIGVDCPGIRQHGEPEAAARFASGTECISSRI